MLNRALEGMGGAGPVDRVRTLVLTGRTRRYLGPDGLAPELPFRTTIVFPRSYRQDLLAPTGPLSTILGPEGAYLAGGPGQPPLQLPEFQRREIEAALMRTPVVLLKTRRDPTFDVFGTARAAEAPFEQVTVWSGGESTVLSLEPGTGRIVRLEYEMRDPAGASGAKISIAYSDFRDVDGLVHAFHITGTREDRPLFETWIEQLVVNQDVDPALFRVAP